MRGSMKLASVALGAFASSAWAQALTADSIEMMGNNSLFTRWRPTSHFIAPAGWMNDPCGAMYDPTRQEYHLFYQWHPNHVNWGNISWGHAVSTDQVTWEDVGGWQDQQAQALGTGPVGSYNGLGIFSGTGQPVNLTGGVDGTLLVFYTSVSKLPTNWKLPYMNGTETQSLAFSTDGGATWQQYEGNPVIDAPPQGWNVTGWRDPFFEPWPEMDEVLGNTEPHFYAVLGSGIKGVGPRMPFYSAPASDLTSWTFLGALWEPQANTTLGPVLQTGTYGFNFEVSGFFSLYDEDGIAHYFVNMGSEGGNVSFHPSDHWALWNEGVVTKRENGSAQFTPVSGGAGDWGNLYALTSFNDTKNNRRVQYGWAPEDNNNFGINQQGFQGCLSLPRELFVKKTEGVLNADGDLTVTGSNHLKQHADGTFTAYTLGVKPLEDVVDGLRDGSTELVFTPCQYNSSTTLQSKGSKSMELTAAFSDVSGQVGLTIGASPDGQEYTHIYYDPSNHTINVNREHSSLIKEFANYTVVGYFYPYTTAEGTEPIVMTVFVDGSMVELYVNDRFALSTRIYPSMEESTGFGVFLGEGASAQITNVTAWTGLKNVFPERPLNSSSALVFDTPEQTNNYTWWPGN